MKIFVIWKDGSMLDLLVPTVAQGLLWAVMALGVYVTFRVLDIADLTVEGSFPLGAAASLLAAGYGPLAAVAAAAVAGMLAGVITGILHTKMKIPALLAGILTMIALYSVNLRIMGKANLSLLGVDTTFSLARDILGLNSAETTFVVGLAATVLIGLFLYWFFGTEIGAAIRATGFNQQMIRAQGVDTNVTIILGLLLSNALVAISGALVAQSNGFADVGMGTGTIVIGLASVIIGEVLFGTRSFKNCMISVILGSIVYRIVIALVLQMGMPPNDLKLFTSVLVAFALSMPLLKNKVSARKAVR
jgi:putative ABC transport system permease protein